VGRLVSETGYGVFVQYVKTGPSKIVYWANAFSEAFSYLKLLEAIPDRNYFAYLTGTPGGHVDDPIYGEPSWSGHATS
jgi:hypothetical protein